VNSDLFHEGKVGKGRDDGEWEWGLIAYAAGLATFQRGVDQGFFFPFILGSAESDLHRIDEAICIHVDG
jgi:hypothetical protein